MKNLFKLNSCYKGYRVDSTLSCPFKELNKHCLKCKRNKG